MRRFTKADIERLVSTPLENLNAMHDRLRIMKTQNELLENANKRFERDVSDFKMTCYKTGRMIRLGD